MVSLRKRRQVLCLSARMGVRFFLFLAVGVESNVRFLTLCSDQRQIFLVLCNSTVVPTRPFAASHNHFSKPCCRLRAVLARLPTRSLDDGVAPAAVAGYFACFGVGSNVRFLNCCSNQRQIFLVPCSSRAVLTRPFAASQIDFA